MDRTKRGMLSISYRRVCLWSCLLLIASISNLTGTVHAQDWDLPGLEREHSVGLRLGEGDTSTWGADAQFMLPLGIHLSADYVVSDESFGDDLRKYSVALSSNPYATFGLSLHYEYSGADDSVETQDYGLGVHYFAGSVLFNARYLQGDVEILANQDLVTSGRFSRAQFSMDREVFELSAQYIGERWQWSVAASEFEYDRDLNLGAESFVAQRVLGAASFNQLFGLLDWYAAVEVGRSIADHDWGLGLAQYALEVSDEDGTSPYISWDWRFSEALSFGAVAAFGLADAEHFAEASLRLHF